MSDLAKAVARDLAFLSARGYDGLYLRIGMNEACGCDLGDLRPCGEVRTGCRPARLDADGLFYPTLKRRREAADSEAR